MAGISNKTFQEIYKNAILLVSGWGGVNGTPKQIMDGAGTTIPLYLSSNSVKIGDTKPLYIGDNNDKFIRNTNSTTTRVVTPYLILSALKTVANDLSAASIAVVSADIATLHGANVTLTGMMKSGTVSATTVKSTGTAVFGTMSATTIKGTFNNAGKGGTVNLRTGSGALVFASAPDYKIGLGTDAKSIVFTINSTSVVKVLESGLIPTKLGINCGANTAASRWRNLYAASAFFKSMTASTGTVKAGTLTATTGTFPNINTTTITADGTIVMKNASLWADQDGRGVLKMNGDDLEITVSGVGLVLEGGNVIRPINPATAFFGTQSYPWKRMQTTKIVTAAISAKNVLPISAASITITGIPTGSVGCVAGQMYFKSATNKTIMVKA